jgi:hypothetical protein
VLLLSAGCATRQIREAQREFDLGAAAELGVASNDAAFESLPGPEGAAKVHYRAAYELSVREQNAHAAELIEDKLLGTARMLELLSGWRLSDLDDDADLRDAIGARLTATIAAARATPSSLDLGTRDRVVLAAMDGLLDHDRGLRATEFARIDGYFSSAYTKLADALMTEKPPALHSVRIWVRLAQLNVCRAWSSTLEKAGDATAEARNAKTLEIHDKWVAAAKALVPFVATHVQLADVLRAKAAEMGVELEPNGIVVRANAVPVRARSTCGSVRATRSGARDGPCPRRDPLVRDSRGSDTAPMQPSRGRA